MSGVFRKLSVHIEGSRRSALDMARGRLILVKGAFVFFYIVAAVRIADLSLIQGQWTHFTARGALEESIAPAEKAARADITDRNGVLLATSLKTASLYADPGLIQNPEKTARALTKILPDLVYGDVLNKLQRDTRFVWVKRDLTPEAQYRILEIGEPGLQFKSEYARVYPQGPLTAHIVGYNNIDDRGQAGIERSFDSLLAQGGEPLALTLDIRLQHILRRELRRAVGEFSAAGGAGVIMDVDTGEILAATSQPDFDPQEPGKITRDQQFNNLTLSLYEPGSTFKIFSTAALLEKKDVPLSQSFDATKPLVSGRHTIRDFHPENRALSVPEVFMYSSNIGSARMGLMVGGGALEDFYKDLGFFAPVKIELEERGRPQYPDPWREISTMTTSYGHGISVTPLHVAAAASAVVGAGRLLTPTLVLDRDRQKNATKNKGKTVVSPQTAHRMRQLMRLAVTDGTGEKADVPGYEVGGKTGTSEKIAARGGYDARRLQSSFIGFFPMSAPRYAVLIVVDEPKPTKASYGYATGGWVAAPAVGRVIAGMAPLLGIMPQEREDELAESLRPYLQRKKNEADMQEKGGTLASFTAQ